MRIILLYDLPFDSEDSKKEYQKFHKWIIKRGYIMMQYSIYFKTISSYPKYPIEVNAIKSNLPPIGNIRLLLITETQFFNIKILNGQISMNEKYNGKERYIKIEDDNNT